MAETNLCDARNLPEKVIGRAELRHAQLRIEFLSNLEDDLECTLHNARILCSLDLSECARGWIRGIGSVEVRVVGRVEGFDAQVDVDPFRRLELAAD